MLLLSLSLGASLSRQTCVDRVQLLVTRLLVALGFLTLFLNRLASIPAAPCADPGSVMGYRPLQQHGLIAVEQVHSAHIQLERAGCCRCTRLYRLRSQDVQAAAGLGEVSRADVHVSRPLSWRVSAGGLCPRHPSRGLSEATK
eukprot:767017-Hanusia_phi.AAC.4